MNYRGLTQFHHAQEDKVGVLITNLGTPSAPTAGALKPYLKQFLSDPRVVEVPRLIWWFILNGIILNTRPKKSAEAYKTIWTERGSPLALYTESQAQKLQTQLTADAHGKVIVEWAMRYGEPSISNGIQSLQEQGATRLLILPLYPQYAGATSGSTFDAVAEDLTQRRWVPELRFINQYTDFMPYIDAVAARIAQFWSTHGRPEKLVFSYHGIPERYLTNGDPYPCQCHKTSRLIAEKLKLPKEMWMTSFQSRFGKEPWVKPYTDDTLKALPGKGVKNVHVVCPGFSSDCLETIEEIGVENRDYFLEAGGENYHYIPALNDDDDHINVLASLVLQNINGWVCNKKAFDDREARYQALVDEQAQQN